MNNLFVITGGPGSGKTTLLNALAADGCRVVPEVARAIIREEIATNGTALPWKNKQLYTDKMIATSLQDYNMVRQSRPAEICFFDRGVLDALCYAEMIGYSLADETMDKLKNCRYNAKVFILPPWKEIYEMDNE